jgi:hypothetical protein
MAVEALFRLFPATPVAQAVRVLSAVNDLSTPIANDGAHVEKTTPH